jgi:hypothetical protein
MALRLREDVSAAETEFGMVLLDERLGRYWELNPSACLALRTLLDGGTLEQAVDALTARFEVGGDRARTDVESLLTSMCAAGLVVV